MRRPSTVVVFLLLSFFAYLWIPDPSTGRALLQLNGQRARYNSAAIGMATAIIASVFVGLAGFYVISNALRRDVQSRCGYVIAATTMRSGEYLLGKFAGNVAFLALFIGGFMLTSMVMLLVRGEAALEPLVFIWQYLLIVPPAIVFVSVLAILFESVPFLSGKFGDVAYFFLWLSSMGTVAVAAERGGSALAFFDYSGFAFMFGQLKGIAGGSSISIGASHFDASKPLFVFNGLQLTAASLPSRLGSLVSSLPLLLIARLFFHRFDPVLVRKTAEKGSRSWAARFRSLIKPLARPVERLRPDRSSRSTSLFGAAVTDARMTLAAEPLLLVAISVFSILALLTPAASIRHGVLPVAFMVAAVMTAEVSCRDRGRGTLQLVFAAPHIQPHFVLWKFLSTLLVLSGIVGVAALRVVSAYPAGAFATIVAILFTTALSTSLGVVSGNAKSFIVVYLTFWYLVMNGKGTAPAIDYAAFFVIPPLFVTAGYAVAAFAALAIAHAVHRRSLHT